jgi:transposase-like protein
MRSGNGKTGRSIGSIRWSFLMLCGSKSATRGLVKNKAVYVALALNPDGEKSVLGLWIEQAEGTKFWLKVVNELKARGDVNDILIAVVDGLKGFPEAITSVFPQTVVQTCIVHLIRNSLAFVSWKDRKAILPSIKAIYRAENTDMALVRLEEFEAEWGKRYPAIGQAWRRAWEHVVPFFAFAPGIRKMTYTTNAVEALHHQNALQLSQRRCRRNQPRETGGNNVVGYDSGDAVSQEYKSPGKFSGGTIQFVGLTVEKAQYLDLEKEAGAAMARE